MVRHRGRRLGFELKYSDAPGVTRSMKIALEDLSLEHVWVVYPGNRAYDLHEQISVIPIGSLCTEFERFG